MALLVLLLSSREALAQFLITEVVTWKEENVSLHVVTHLTFYYPHPTKEDLRWCAPDTSIVPMNCNGVGAAPARLRVVDKAQVFRWLRSDAGIKVKDLRIVAYRLKAQDAFLSSLTAR